MNMPFQPASRAQQLSPISTTGSEWSGMNHYDPHNRMDSPYSPSIAFKRGDLTTSPDSGSYGGHINGQMNGGYIGPRPPDIPHGRRPSENGSRNSSPAPSITNSRSSDGTISDHQSRKYKQMEYEVSQHYTILRQYLKGGAPQPPRPNKARDKLLRLSPVQFHELSTDVFDELQRRQAANPLPGRPPRRENVPPYLQPRVNFHEKRNQARQKLSSLQTARFRDLSTDVFCELERRFPHFANVNRSEGPRSQSRGPSGGPANGYSTGAQGTTGFVPPPRNPSNGSQGSFSQKNQRLPPRNGSMANVPQFDNPPAPGPADGGYGRPTPKQFQSNIVTPNKSTMVEDDYDEASRSESRFDRSSDAFGLESAIASPMSQRDTSATSRSATSAHRDGRLLELAQAQASELQFRVDELEETIMKKDEEIKNLEGVSNKNSDSNQTYQELEGNLKDAEKRCQYLNNELEKLHVDRAEVERDLRSQLDAARTDSANSEMWKEKHDRLDREYHTMQTRLQKQRQLNEEVKLQATGFLNEMRAMADGGGGNHEREEKLHNDVQRLQEEVREWKARYAKTKTQLRNVRASSLGLSIARPDASRSAKDDAFRDEEGLVRDVNITKFQIAIDELLRIARSGDPSAVLDYMTAVVFAVRSITEDIDAATTSSKDDDLTKRRLKLKSKISVTANNVITASKNFAMACGISPVSLLDAAASHLTAAVVELVRTVKIRPTQPGDTEDDDDGTLQPAQVSSYFDVAASMRRRSAQESVYSALSTPSDTHLPSGPGPSLHNRSAPYRVNGENGVSPGPSVKSGYGLREEESELEELRVYLDDKTNDLVQSVTELLNSIRSEDLMPIVRSHISNIIDVVDDVVSATEGSFEEPSSFSSVLRERTGPITINLNECKKNLMTASVESQSLDTVGRGLQVKDFTARLPPLAFEIARQTKELVLLVEKMGTGEQFEVEIEDFS